VRAPAQTTGLTSATTLLHQVFARCVRGAKICKLLSAGRVNSDQRIEVRLGRAEFHGQCIALRNFACVGSDVVKADHTVASALVNHQLSQAGLFQVFGGAFFLFEVFRFEIFP